MGVTTTGTPVVDPYLFPARGRKRDEERAEINAAIEVDPYLFPARGRKPPGAAPRRRIVNLEVDPYLFPARGRKRGRYGCGG